MKRTTNLLKENILSVETKGKDENVCKIVSYRGYIFSGHLVEPFQEVLFL